MTQEIPPLALPNAGEHSRKVKPPLSLRRGLNFLLSLLVCISFICLGLVFLVAACFILLQGARADMWFSPILGLIGSVCWALGAAYALKASGIEL